MASQVTIKFLRDFIDDYELSIVRLLSGVTTNQTWTWATTRTTGFEVTTGTPTATQGERTAINFKAAFDLDNASGFTTTLQNVNEVLIQSNTTGEDFIGVSVKSDLGLMLPQGIDYQIVFDNFIPPFDLDTLDFALVRSPYYINVPYRFDTTTKATFDLFIWSGDVTSPPLEPTYSFTNVRPSIDYEEYNADISSIMREAIDGKPNIDLTSPASILSSGSSEAKWCKYVVSYTDPEENIADIQGTLLACEGYGYYLEGVNPSRPSNDVLTSSSYRKMSRDGFVLIPFYNDGTITNIKYSTETNQIDGTFVPTQSDSSNKIVQYLIIDLSVSTTDNFLEVEFNGSTLSTFVYEIDDECRYEPKQIIFKNRWGFYDTLTFFKKSSTSLNVESDMFVNSYINNGTYDVTDHQYQSINIQGKESISLNSGYIKESENAIYKEMMLSDKIFIYDPTNNIPCTLKSKSLEFKTRVNDKLVNYNIELEYAYNSIQNV